MLRDVKGESVAVSRPAIITLTTDFGTQDGYVGAMAGVILSQCPEARVVAITHDVPPHDLQAGAWALRNAWPWFPTGTVHVVVVDPGVGSERRGILVRARGQTFIAPDNGIIPEALGGTTLDEVRELGNPAARAKTASATFHGRDVFAWAAGWLAAGNDWSALGSPVPPSELVTLPDRSPLVERDGERLIVVGAVMIADRFGNLVTTIGNDLLPRQLGASEPRVFVNRERVPFRRTFSDVEPGQAVAYLGSSGLLEIAVNQRSAVARFGTNPAIRVVVRKR